MGTYTQQQMADYEQRMLEHQRKIEAGEETSAFKPPETLALNMDQHRYVEATPPGYQYEQY